MEGDKVKESFSTFAPRLWELGWRGLVPLRPYQKVPSVQRWQRYNEGQSVAEMKELIGSRSGRLVGSGVGCCAGNGVLFVDLDIEDQKALIRAVVIAEDILGVTPLHRIGLPPKRVLMYRSDMPGLRRNPRDLAIEIYGGGQPATGQVVLLGIHPKTRRPYEYLHEHPLDTPLNQLPEIYEEQIEDLIEALATDPIIQDRGMAKGREFTGVVTSNAGITLQEAAKRRDLSGGLGSWVASTTPGGRHAAAVAACTVVMQSGLNPDEEAIELEAIEIGFREAKPEAAACEWREILQWARSKAPMYTRSELVQRLGMGGVHGRP